MAEMYTKVMEVTPEQAAKWLEGNRNNRRISARCVNEYAELMRSGNWPLTHQGIAFTENGEIADGQHRLSAIVKAGIPVKMQVSFNAPRSEFIDCGKKRSEVDRAIMGGLIDKNDPVRSSNIMISTAKMACGLIKSVRIGISLDAIAREYRPTESELIGYMNKWIQGFTFIHGLMSHYTGSAPSPKGSRSASVQLSMLSAYYGGVDKSVLKEWWTVLNTGLYDDVVYRNLTTARSIILLRNYLNNNFRRNQNYNVNVPIMKTVMRSISDYDHNIKRGQVREITAGASIYKIPGIEEDLLSINGGAEQHDF